MFKVSEQSNLSGFARVSGTYCQSITTDTYSGWLFEKHQCKLNCQKCGRHVTQKFTITFILRSRSDPANLGFPELWWYVRWWKWRETSWFCWLTILPHPLVDIPPALSENICVGPWEIVSYVICEQQKCRSACASAQSDQAFVVRCLDRIISLDSIAEISRL